MGELAPIASTRKLSELLAGTSIGSPLQWCPSQCSTSFSTSPSSLTGATSAPASPSASSSGASIGARLLPYRCWPLSEQRFGFAFDRHRAGRFEGAAGLAHEHDLFVVGGPFLRADQHTESLGRHLAGERARGEVERLGQFFGQRRPQRPGPFLRFHRSRVHVVANQHGGRAAARALTPDAPRLLGAGRPGFFGRRADHRHFTGGQRGVGLRQRFFGRARLRDGERAVVRAGQGERQHQRDRRGEGARKQRQPRARHSDAGIPPGAQGSSIRSAGQRIVWRGDQSACPAAVRRADRPARQSTVRQHRPARSTRS